MPPKSMPHTAADWSGLGARPQDGRSDYPRNLGLDLGEAVWEWDNSEHMAQRGQG